MHNVCYIPLYAMLYTVYMHLLMLVFAYSLHNVYLYINIGLAQKTQEAEAGSMRKPLFCNTCNCEFFVNYVYRLLYPSIIL